jgi:hypothetical protein
MIFLAGFVGVLKNLPNLILTRFSLGSGVGHIILIDWLGQICFD